MVETAIASMLSAIAQPGARFVLHVNDEPWPQSNNNRSDAPMPDTQRSLPTIVIDAAKELLVFNGVPMTFDLLEMFTRPTPDGQWFRVTKVNGSSAIETKWSNHD